ncbi:MAG: hypothetical protein U0K53_02850 [Paludibacteraceae bacterium]|nr:hypothetical protein [Paludibacteraceae bacterium]
MKKILISIVTIFAISFFALAEMTIYVYKKDGTKVPYVASAVDSIGFVDVTLPEAVDLGLPSGTKWANMNVGANKPEDYGDYFAWGETTPKSTYYWSTYKWCKGSFNTMTKYCTYSSLGTVDNKIILDLSDDAAYVNWGTSWRMPTRAEQDELRNTSYTTWTWTTQNGVKGYKVTSQTNGNSIFLPAAGYPGVNTAGYVGYYWSSSLITFDSSCPYILYFDSDGVSCIGHYRCYGYSVRPVLAE